MRPYRNRPHLRGRWAVATIGFALAACRGTAANTFTDATITDAGAARLEPSPETHPVSPVAASAAVIEDAEGNWPVVEATGDCLPTALAVQGSVRGLRRADGGRRVEFCVQDPSAADTACFKVDLEGRSYNAFRRIRSPKPSGRRAPARRPAVKGTPQSVTVCAPPSAAGRGTSKSTRPTCSRISVENTRGTVTQPLVGSLSPDGLAVFVAAPIEGGGSARLYAVNPARLQWEFPFELTEDFVRWQQWQADGVLAVTCAEAGPGCSLWRFDVGAKTAAEVPIQPAAADPPAFVDANGDGTDPALVLGDGAATVYWVRWQDGKIETVAHLTSTPGDAECSGAAVELDGDLAVVHGCDHAGEVSLVDRNHRRGLLTLKPRSCSPTTE